MDQYIAMIIAILPSIINILSTIAIFFKLVNNFKSSLNAKTSELEELKNQYKVLLQENYELKALLKEYLTKIDHIARE